MKKFIFKVCLFMTILTLITIALLLFNFYVVSNQNLYTFTSSIIDKVDRLKSINEPKIVLTGNSNLAFGINSELIEKKLNMKVVNLGLHGDFDNIFHENMAKENLNSGDIVVLCHTSYDTDGLINDYNLAWTTIEKHTELYKFIDKKDYYNMFISMFQYAKKSTYQWITNSGNERKKGQYSRDAFNQYGDVVKRNKPLNPKSIFKGSMSVPKLNADTINRLNSYNDYIKSKGAYLVISYAPIGFGEKTPSSDKYESFEETLKNSLNAKLISHYSDYFIPYEYFLDTKNHLTEEGVNIRTKQLINDLKNWKKDNYMN